MVGHELFDFLVLQLKQKLVVAPHRVVADRHDLAEHFPRRIGKGDVVVMTFGHLLHPVEPDKKRHRDNGLFQLAGILLQHTAHEHVEELIGAADFDIGVEHQRIVALDQGVEEFDNGDRCVPGVALGEVVALQHAGDSHLAGEFEAVFKAHFVEPLAVVVYGGFVLIENAEGLVEIGLRVFDNLLSGQNRACGGAPGGGRRSVS